MGKLKPRIKGKGKRWAKGQSSSSNPSITKFRDAAKSKFFTPNLGTSRALTIGALKTHNAFSTLNIKKQEPSEPIVADESEWSDAASDESGASTATFKTFASEWSNCSNLSFSKLLNNFQPNSALHKEMLAVLAAVTEVIKSNGGTETSTEYFGALMTALDASESEDSTAAILSLLSMGIKTVPQEVLRLKFSEISKSFLDTFTKHSDGDNFVIIRNVIGCLSVTLRAQDAAVWSFPSTHQIFHSILVFTVFTKPKVRKAAQHAVLSILKGSTLLRGDATHPAAANTAKFCVSKLEGGAASGGLSSALHILALLKEILSTFPKAFIKSCCEAILKLLTLGNVVTTSCSLQALHGLFSSAPPPSRLTPTLNAQLIHALYDYQPPVTDPQAVLAWLTVIQEAYSNLARIEPGLCLQNTVQVFTVVTQLWLCDNSKVTANAAHALRCIALDCFPQCCQLPNYASVTDSVFALVEEGLKYQYHNAWLQVLNLLAALFEAVGPTAAQFSHRSLSALAALRDAHNFPHTAALEFTVGKAVRTLGPEPVLAAIPLHIPTPDQLQRTWLLPVLKENIQTAPLGFFVKYFLPLANTCRKRSDELAAAQQVAGSRTYELLCSQIWALLPSFCTSPPDVATSFRGLAPTLGVVLNDRKSLRMSVMAALRKLVHKSQETKNEENLRVIGRYSKNFLPILFNIYTTKPVGTDEEGQRLAAFDTIKVYVSVASTELSGELFDKAFSRLQDAGENAVLKTGVLSREKDAGEDSFLKASVLDLIKALLPNLDEPRLEKVFQLCMAVFQKPDKSQSEEKKAYRILEDLCGCESAVCRTFMSGKIPVIRKRLLRSVSKQSGGRNAGARLRCLRLLLPLLPPNQLNIIKTLVPEAVLMCKNSNASTRACAFDLLIDMFKISQTWSKKASSDMVRDYVELVLGGLAGSPALVSATLAGMARLTYTLSDQLPADTITLLIQSVCVLLAEPAREIAAASLGYIKTLLTAFPSHTILVHLPLIVSSICSMTEDCKRHSRIKIRDVLDRMLRKFGPEAIKEFVPADDAVMHKRINNLRKLNDRKKKMKNVTENEEDSDVDAEFAVQNKPKSIEEILASSDESEEEESEGPERSRGSRRGNKAQGQKGNKGQGQMYIREDEDDIVDLASPTAATKLSAKKPTLHVTAKPMRKESAFEMTSTGKLVIPRDLASGKQQQQQDSDDDDDMDLDIESVSDGMSRVEISRKRKSPASVRSDPPLKYQAGGSGIHRPILTKKQKSQKGADDGGIKTGKEYRAKKAQGDVKLAGKPDPYAYIPLSRKLLNKRNKARTSGRFNNIIKSAVRGARAGAKTKSKRSKK